MLMDNITTLKCDWIRGEARECVCMSLCVSDTLKAWLHTHTHTQPPPESLMSCAVGGGGLRLCWYIKTLVQNQTHAALLHE